MNHLNQFTSQYRPGAQTYTENDLVLNWYPGRILDRLGSTSDLSLLELGLGHGISTNIFNPFFGAHTVIEGSSDVINLFRASHSLPELSLVEGYFENFESSERFDVIVMGFVLEHVDDPALIVSKYRSLLKPGGRLFIAVPNAKSLNRRLGLAMGKIDDIYELNANDHLMGHQRQYCLETLTQMLEEQGFRVCWQEGIYLKPLPLAVLQSMPDFHENMVAMCQVGVEFPELCVGLLVEAVPS